MESCLLDSLSASHLQSGKRTGVKGWSYKHISLHITVVSFSSARRFGEAVPSSGVRDFGTILQKSAEKQV